MINSFLTANLKNENDKNELKAQLSYFANTYVSSYKPSTNVLRKHGILQKLRRNREIFILKPDKGNGVVILNRKD